MDAQCTGRQKSFGKFLLLFVTAIGIASFALAACVAPASPTPRAPAKEKPVSVPEGVELAEEQVFRYAYISPLSHMSPFLSQGSERGVLPSIFMPPLAMDIRGNISPWLVNAWEVSEDGLSVTLHIDPRAVWRDGSPVTAAQMKAAWEYAVNPDNNPRASQFLEVLDKVKGYAVVANGEAAEMEGLVVVDDRTLRLDLTAPNLLQIFYLTHPILGVGQTSVDRPPCYACRSSTLPIPYWVW